MRCGNRITISGMLLAMLAGSAGCIPTGLDWKADKGRVAASRLSEEAGGEPIRERASRFRAGGPRAGLVMATGDIAEGLKAAGNDSVRTAVGWQFEYQFMTSRSGVELLTEFVPLLVGLEQGMFNLSTSVLVGVRMPNGLEFGLGPNLTIFDEEDYGVPNGGTEAELGMAFAVGYTLEVDNMRFPFNVAWVMSEGGTSISFLLGWNVAY